MLRVTSRKKLKLKQLICLHVMSNGLVVCRSENIFLLSMPKCLGDKKRDFQSTTNDRQKDEKIVKNHSDFLECTHIIERSAAKSIDPS